ncbi:MAG: peptidase C11 [Clostridium sp.]|nr:peptidase C11 [Clostridium sp.]
MDKNNRPTGRQKRIGSGIGNVQRRGSGLKGRTGGAVGGNGGNSSGTRGKSSRGGFNLITLLLIIAIGGYYLYTTFGGDSGNQTGGNSFQTGSSNYGTTFVDNGAYPVNTEVSELAREKRTVLKGNGKDTATVMIYMCGTDLESRSGLASSDLNEMIDAQISDKVNIIVETGGTTKWQNSIVKSNSNQRYKVTKKGLELLEGNLGKKPMVDPETLSDFIKYCKNNFPADRYFLIMWDHGGGSISGFGYDQHFPGDSMTLDEIGIALKNGNCSFDLIGFDACLMATLETALVLEPYADYMIASEEVEPGIGWYYTGWITALSQNTSIPTTELGKKLIDDYVREVERRTPRSQGTLSLIDLAELKGTVPATFAKFATSTKRLVDNDDYKIVSKARANTKEFAKSSKINQIDLIHFVENIGTPEAKSFAKALRGCIKYNRTSKNITNANGVSIFFPYDSLSKLNSMLETYERIGINDEYRECIKSFANVTAGGQIVSDSSGNMLQVLLESILGNGQTTTESLGAEALESLLNEFLSSGDYSSITGLVGNSLGWLDIDRIKSSVDYYAKNRLTAGDLKITEKNGQRVLSLSEEQWDLVHHMEMNVFIDDGEGFIDLGLDNVYEYNEDGDLIMEFDGTWLALNGHIVSYYMMTDDHYGDTYSIKGRVPALLNGKLVDIIIVFDNENPYGVVQGAQIRYDAETETETVSKGLIEIKAGDKIDFLCDYYTYDGEYIDTYFLGEQYTATGEWKVENLPIDKDKYLMSYRITDIYNNQYWTPTVTNRK